jgi:hypothetical protein
MLKYAKYLFLLIYIFGVFLISLEALKDGNESSNASNDVAVIVGGAIDKIGGVVDQIGGVIDNSQNNNDGSIETPGEESGGSNGNSQLPDENTKEPENNNENIEEGQHEHVFVNAICECGEKDPNYITRFNFNIVKFRYIVRKLVGHFGAFLFLGIFASLTYYCFINKNKFLALLMTIVAGLVVASFSELLQFIPSGRCPAFKDVLIDMAGYMVSTITLSLILYLPYFIKKISNKKISNR